jgi:hypothetical protein
MRALGVSVFLALVLLLPGATPALAAEEQIVVDAPVHVRAGETSGDIVLLDGSVRVDGRVDGYLISLGAPVTIFGRVDGDVYSLSEPIRLGPRAVVDGDVYYGDEKPVRARGSRVTGDVKELDAGELLTPFGIAAHIAIWIAVSASSLVLGLLMLWLAPGVAGTTLATARRRPGPAIAVGLAGWIALPLAAFVALVTLIGIPLGIVLLAALLPLAALSYVTSLWLLGRTILPAPRARAVAFLAGWGILRLIALIPVVGWLVWAAATVFGLGVLLVSAWHARPLSGPAQPQAA